MQAGSLKGKVKTALETLEMGFQEGSDGSWLNQRFVVQGSPANGQRPQGPRRGHHTQGGMAHPCGLPMLPSSTQAGRSRSKCQVQPSRRLGQILEPASMLLSLYPVGFTFKLRPKFDHLCTSTMNGPSIIPPWTTAVASTLGSPHRLSPR